MAEWDCEGRCGACAHDRRGSPGCCSFLPLKTCVLRLGTSINPFRCITTIFFSVSQPRTISQGIEPLNPWLDLQPPFIQLCNFVCVFGPGQQAVSSPDSSRNRAVVLWKKTQQTCLASPAFVGVIDLEAWNVPVPLIDLSAWRGGSFPAPTAIVINGRVTRGWRSSSYGFFNLPDTSHWQRLITRWHGALMVLLTHLLLGGEREWGWRCMMSVCAQAHWLDIASPPSGQGVIESGAVISVHEVACCLTHASTPILPIPLSRAVRPGRLLLATSSWVGYNSSPDGDRALSQSPSTGLALARSVLGKRFSGAPVCEL